jgi:hypothetical protein
MDKASSEVEDKLTGQVPPLTILSKDKASGMPADTLPEWPDLSESLLLSYSSEEGIDERPEFGVDAGRRYKREYTIFENGDRPAKNAMRVERSVDLWYEGLKTRGYVW